MIIQLTEIQKERARAYARVMWPYHSDRGRDEEVNKAKVIMANIAYGKLGEEAVVCFLNYNGIDVEVDYTIRKSKTAGPLYDFLINGKTIDAKTGYKPY